MTTRHVVALLTIICATGAAQANGMYTHRDSTLAWESNGFRVDLARDWRGEDRHHNRRWHNRGRHHDFDRREHRRYEHGRHHDHQRYDDRRGHRDNRRHGDWRKGPKAKTSLGGSQEK